MRSRPVRLAHQLLQIRGGLADVRSLFVGVDAGTSGVRVAVRDEYSGRTGLFDFGPNKVGGTRFSFPTSIGVADDRLIFGNEVTEIEPTSRLVSVKAALVHPEVADDLEWQCQSLGLLPRTNTGHGSPAEMLYAILIAHALEKSLPNLVRSFGHPPDAALAFSFAVGAPVADDKQEQLKFRRALAAAVLLQGNVGGSPKVKDLLDAYSAAIPNAHSLAARCAAEQNVYVKPEAFAAVRGLYRLHQPDNNFLVVDIGATTTEFAVIRVGDNCLACFAAASIPVGVDDADRSVLSIPGSDLLKARLERHACLGNDLPVEVAGALSNIAKKLRNVLGEVLKAAIDEKNCDEKSWSEFYVVVVGGGSNIPVLADGFKREALPHEFVRRTHSFDAAVTDHFVVGESNVAVASNELFELPAVLGMASPVYEDMEAIMPADVPVVEPIYEDPLGELQRQWKKNRPWLR
jgi:hypothetical protein